MNHFLLVKLILLFLVVITEYMHGTIVVIMTLLMDRNLMNMELALVFPLIKQLLTILVSF